MSLIELRKMALIIASSRSTNLSAIGGLNENDKREVLDMLSTIPKKLASQLKGLDSSTLMQVISQVIQSDTKETVDFKTLLSIHEPVTEATAQLLANLETNKG